MPQLLFYFLVFGSGKCFVVMEPDDVLLLLHCMDMPESHYQDQVSWTQSIALNKVCCLGR